MHLQRPFQSSLPSSSLRRTAEQRSAPHGWRLTPVSHALAVLAMAGGMAAPAQAQRAFSGAWFASKGVVQNHAAQTGLMPSGQPLPGAAGQPPRAAGAAFSRSLNNLNAAARLIASQQAAQLAARQAAMGGAPAIPDGLAPGGLAVDTDSLTAGWLNASAPTQTAAGGQTTVTVEQTDDKAILNWESFNVGRNTTLRFDQRRGTSARDGRNTWIAFNRVNDPSGKPSEIAGRIQADGTVYIVNRNGIIFNGSSQVNTRGLIASSLALTDQQFQRGINNPESLNHAWAGAAPMPAFGDHSTKEPTFLEADDWAPTLPVPGHVVVNAGAQLDVSDSGKLMLFGTQVRNAGALSVRDGQIILAAGEQIWLGEDLNGVRGLDVAVSGPMPSLLLQQNATWINSKPNWQSTFMAFDLRMRNVVFPALEARGEALDYQVTNTGAIHADRGSITLQSREVNQQGVITAMTALNNRDGSIRLRAWGQGGVFYTTNAAETYGNFAMHWSAGTLTVGSGSVALVLPDAGDTSQIEATDLATRYTPGSIRLHGRLIDLQTGSLTLAPSGVIDIISATNPFNPTAGSIPSTEPGYGQYPRDGSRIYIDSDAVVSVAGLQDVAVDMSRNFVEVDMRINELRDSPLQRDSWLRGQKLVVDRRESGVFENGPMAGVLWGGKAGAWAGTPLADVSGWLGVGKTDLQELSTTGGSISLKSGGTLVMREGSLLDISGGSVRYQDGMNTASKLSGADGRIYTMANAYGMVYTGIAGRYVNSHSRWGVEETFRSPLIGAAHREAGYVEGRNAGSLQMYISNGTVLEGDIAGGIVAGGRQRTSGAAAKPGEWVFGGGGNIERAWLLGQAIITDTPEKLGAGFTRATALDERFVRDTPLDSTTWIDGDMLERSGLGTIRLHVAIGFAIEAGTQLELAPRTEFQVSANASSGVGMVFDVGGSIRSAGGHISLLNIHADGGELLLRDGVRIDVGGEWVNELSGGAPAGGPARNAGSIVLNALDITMDGRAELVVSGGGRAWLDKGKRRLAMGNAGSIQLSGFRAQDIAQLDMQAFSAGSGGQLRLMIDGPVQAGGDPAAQPGAMHLPADLYGDRGFSAITIESSGNVDIADGAQLGLVQLGWDMAGVDYAAIPSGASLPDLLAPTLLRPEQRLKNNAVSLTMQAGSSGGGTGALRIGEGASIRLDTGGSVTLSAYDMAVLGTIEAPAGAIALSSTTMALGESASLLARGAAVLYRNAQGLATGEVLDGGTVTLGARDLALEPGSLIDVSGASGLLESPARLGARKFTQSHAVASNGGSITISGQGLLATTLAGHAGGAGAQGGSLAIQHISPPGGDSLLNMVVQNFCNNFGYCTPDLIVGVDFAKVLEQFGISGLPEMVIPQSAFDVLGSASRVGLSVSGAATPGGGPGETVDPAALGITADAMDQFREWLSLDFRNMTPVNSLLAVRPASLAGGGFGKLRLAGGAVEVDDIHLSATQSLTIDGVLRRAPGAGGQASLAAPLLVLRQGAAPGAPGLSGERSGTLALRAEVVDVQGGSNVDGNLGSAAIRGFGETTLDAQELRFSVVNYAASLEANPTARDATLSVDGALVLNVGQVWPATAVNARIVSGESITVRASGQAPAAPLSAGGSLTLSAPVIEQHGVLRAPFGQITLDAGERLVLGAGSLTSVSGAGLLLPYGKLLNNEYWAAPFSSTEGTGVAMLPDKRIILAAPVVDSAAGSVIDIRGGGDLHASEFVAGTGGSHDILSLPGAYAVVPGHASPVAPGTAAVAGTAGSSLWLAGGNGLAAGWYTLMPASYAALPGAWLVMPSGAASSFNPAAGAALFADGSVVMAGRRGNALDRSADAQASYWQVMSAAQARQYSEYNEAKASAFFLSDAFKLTQYRLTGVDMVTPRLPGDGGSVVFKAGERLVLDGQLFSRADAGGRGGLVDIAGQKIAVVGAGEDTSDLQAAGYLLIDAGKLSGFGAGSLLVGGMRSGNALGLGVEVSGSDIVVRNGSGSALYGAEIILAASDRVKIEDGSVVLAQGDTAQAAGDLIMAQQLKAVWQVNDNGTSQDPGDDFSTLVTPGRDWGALVRVSTGPAVKVVRENVDIMRGGLVDIGAGARLSGGAALLIDATRSTVLSASASVSGAALSVASSRIGLGGGSEGLVLGAATLAQLASTGELTLRSYSSIDFHRDIDFSGSGLKAVVLDGARLSGYSGDVAVNADTLTLVNSGAQAAVGGAGGGTLALSAGELVLGAGAKAIEGFSAIRLSGRQRIVAEDKGSLDAGAAQLGLDTPVLTGRQGSSQAIATTGALTVAGDTAAPVSGADGSLGASLSLTGGSIDMRGRIAALGGAVSLTALTGDLVLGGGSLVDTGGFAKDFFDVFAYANAGRIQLTAERGNIRQDAGAALNLSAHAGGGSGGTLSVKTAGGGSVDLSGALAAQAGAGGKGGSFVLDLAELPGFGALGQRLNDAGFSASRAFRVRNGDVTVDGSTRAQDFSLTADQGTVTLTGTIDARSSFGGRIAITGGDGVAMAGTALLRAGATDAVLGSGRVTLEASSGQLDLQGGVIDVAGGEGGRVRLRARQSANHDEIAVSALGAALVGARSAVLEGVAVYGGVSSVDAVKAEAVADAHTFAGHTAAMAARLANGSVTLMPGIEIRSDGDLTLGADWNLLDSFGAGLREGGLTLRAAGNLIIGANLSDGFDAATRAGILQDTASWDLRLVSGADLRSASATALRQQAVLAQGSGSLVIGDAAHGYMVRTGTGDIDASVGRDLDLAHEESVIYTAGRRDTTVWSDFETVPSRLSISQNWPREITRHELPTAAYGIQGGSLRVNAQGDVSSTLSEGGKAQFFAEWLLRLGRKEREDESGQPTVVTFDMPFVPGQQSTWFVDYAKFNQGMGALGGGNVSVSAGGSINDLLVAMPTNGRVRGGRSPGEAMALELRNGGALDVVAEGDIRGGRYYIGRGEGQLRATELAASVRQPATAPVLALGDATLAVTTSGDLRVATVADPLLTHLPYMNEERLPIGAMMTGYTDASALDLVSIGGDVVLGAEQMLGGRFMGSGSFTGIDIYPSKVHITALSGSVNNEAGVYNANASHHHSYNVDWSGLMFVMPSAQADLRLLADKDVRLGEIAMSRMSPQALPHPLNPMRDAVDSMRIWFFNNQMQSFGYPVNGNVGDAWQADDRTPSRIYARTGSIVREVSGEVFAAEQLWVRAGQDVRGLRLNLRNNHGDDVSIIEAGNDVNGTTAAALANFALDADIKMQGPGSLLVSAGRDVYNVNAISVGNIQNWDSNNFPDENSRIKHLPDEGASIHVMAGMNGRKPDYAAFLAGYLDPAKVASMPGYLVAALADGTRVPRYLLDEQEPRGGETKTVQRGLVSFVAEATGEKLDPLQAWARFQTLAQAAQEVFLRRVFQQELREAGRDQNQPGTGGLPLNGGYNRGYAAIAALFPGDGWKGDVVADSMTLRTMLGGDVTVFAPGGKFQAAALTRAPAAGEGLVTLAGGHVGIFARDSVTVNRSRVLTFVPEATSRGSDMIIWSTQGDVDAGRGAKTVRVPSKPVVATDLDGNTTVTERSDMSGSGIGTVGDGDVDLVAPGGTVNAGDAGLRVAGNLNIAALQVLNADNIEVEGESTGLPVVAAVNIGALTNASAAASQAAAAAQDVLQRERTAARQNLPSVFTVRVLGFGSEPMEAAPDAPARRPAGDSAGYRPQGPVQVVGDGPLTEAQKALLTVAERRTFGL